MNPARHVMILASAGSGKTFALTNRFVQRLAEGARPERIVALTFTRKAAGEFFDEILNKLAGAAGDAGRAARLAHAIGHPALGRADFLAMLRAVTDALPRLRLGTLDSFFAHVARTFPLELGLAGDFEILPEQAARLERRRVLGRMFARAGALDAAQRDFLEAFKRATFGREEKRLGAQLDEFLDRYEETYLDAPAAACWGDPGRLWPAGNPWLEARPDPVAAARGLREWLARAAPAEKQRARWEAFLAAVATWAPGAALPGELTYVLTKALAAGDDLPAGRAVLEFDRRPQELDAAAGAALAGLVAHLIGGELARRLEATRGIHAVLHGYERHYHAAVRREGRLTFGDVQRLLEPAAGAPALSRAGAGAGRIFLDYRLDAGIDHWLLDEFQDTSHGQWSILQNLIDEVVQDPSGGRSFFCVGDVKQAIFTWRGGDPRLFREIFHHYNAAAPGAIAEENLDESWRSGPPLIAMVNTVFGGAAALAALFPGEMSRAWNREWRAHRSAVPERTGQAAWLLAEDGPARHRLVLELLRELRPLERGLSCAVLVQQNTTAAALADFLRQQGGLPAVAESDLPVCTDNPLGAALLALVQAAAHPGDTFAAEHVRMTPLGAALAAAGLTTPEAVTAGVLGQIHAAGFERTLEGWVAAVEPRLAPDDAFSRRRARQIVAAARLFDGTGSRDAAEFLGFMQQHTVREGEAAAAVRVMTIHKAKGLGFDVVLLPDLEGTKLDQARDGLAVHKGRDRAVEWVLDAPARLIASADPVLAGQAREAEAEAGYEALSLLYVAMTRAKRAMYVITAPPGTSTSRNYPRVLQETLGTEAGEVRVGARSLPGIWSAGDPDWHGGLPVAEPVAPPDDPLPCLEDTGHRVTRHEARRPSERRREFPAEVMFSLAGRAAADFGSAVHALLAAVEWGTTDPEAVWEGRGEPAPARAEARAVLQTMELAEVWTRPKAAGAEVWRERSFEVVIDGLWVSGVFDRVVIERDGAGRVTRATVYDFKTDRVTEADLAVAAARHHDQLNLYRRVVGILTGLPGTAVAAELVFTRIGRRVAVPPAGG